MTNKKFVLPKVLLILGIFILVSVVAWPAYFLLFSPKDSGTGVVRIITFTQSVFILLPTGLSLLLFSYLIFRIKKNKSPNGLFLVTLFGLLLFVESLSFKIYKCPAFWVPFPQLLVDIRYNHSLSVWRVLITLLLSVPITSLYIGLIIGVWAKYFRKLELISNPQLSAQPGSAAEAPRAPR